MSIMSFAQRYKCFCQWKLQLLFCSWNDSFSVSAKFAFLFSAHLGASSIGSLYAINFLYTDFLSLLLGLTPSSFQYTFYPETSSVFVKTLEHFCHLKTRTFYVSMFQFAYVLAVALFVCVRGAVPPNSRYPDTIAVCYSSVDNKLTCIYNDHSLYIWDVTDIKKVGKMRSFLFHSGAVWGIDVSLPVLSLLALCIVVWGWVIDSTEKLTFLRFS